MFGSVLPAFLKMKLLECQNVVSNVKLCINDQAYRSYRGRRCGPSTRFWPSRKDCLVQEFSSHDAVGQCLQEAWSCAIYLGPSTTPEE